MLWVMLDYQSYVYIKGYFLSLHKVFPKVRTIRNSILAFLITIMFHCV